MLELRTPVCKEYPYIGLEQYFKYWEEQGWVKIVKLPPDRRYTSWFINDNKKIYLCPEHINDAVKNNDGKIISMQYRREWINIPNVIGLSMWIRDYNQFEEVDIDCVKNNLSIFSGTIRGDKHTRNLWVNSTSIWSSSPAKRYTKTNKLFPTLKDYYQKCAATKYGLVLRGDSAWGQRIHEYMACGCIPIITDGTDVDLYYGKMEEYEHYLYAKNKEEMMNKIINIDYDHYNYMRTNILNYFKNYNSKEGLFNTINKIIKELK